jgi:hypothetical protein
MLHAFLGSESTMKTAMILTSEKEGSSSMVVGRFVGRDMLV